MSEWDSAVADHNDSGSGSVYDVLVAGSERTAFEPFLLQFRYYKTSKRLNKSGELFIDMEKVSQTKSCIFHLLQLLLMPLYLPQFLSILYLEPVHLFIVPPSIYLRDLVVRFLLEFGEAIPYF